MNGSLQAIRQWSLIKKTLFVIALLTFVTSSFLYLTAPGGKIRQWLAETVITTQHRSWAWIFVGAERRDLMVKKLQNDIELAAAEEQNLGLVSVRKHDQKHRSINELIKVEDISSQFYKGKKMYVYDPTTIKIMTPSKVGEGERITSMVNRTGAVAGLNGGAFNDPEGLGNGFAALGMIVSEGEIIFTDQDGSIPQHIVGFTKEGRLVVGKYDAFELRDMGVTEAVSFYPRLIANGKPLITSGDGGWGRAPRSVVGQRADGTVIFIVVDGRQTHSVGATLKEMQDLLLEEGCVIAGNLDGGASSELVVDGELVTKPSSRYGERRLPSAFLVYDNPGSVKAPRIWDGIDKIDAGGSYDHPDFLREQAEKKAKQQNNPSNPPAKPATETDKTKTTPGKQDSVKHDTEKTPNGSGTPADNKDGKDNKDNKANTPTGGKTSPPTGTTGKGATGSPGKGEGTGIGSGAGSGNPANAEGDKEGSGGISDNNKAPASNTQSPGKSDSNPSETPAGSKGTTPGNNTGTGAADSSSPPPSGGQANNPAKTGEPPSGSTGSNASGQSPASGNNNPEKSDAGKTAQDPNPPAQPPAGTKTP
ncbi:phosphodiester glycosidase family protein [Paenibacillus filicis]|uniref:Phosphodiester glycosidase family protein n=1 Tax=Paenibacillus filicis TaxID=669464 RepID=A0ABU9DT36_9BACL